MTYGILRFPQGLLIRQGGGKSSKSFLDPFDDTFSRRTRFLFILELSVLRGGPHTRDFRQLVSITLKYHQSSGAELPPFHSFSMPDVLTGFFQANSHLTHI